MTKQEQIKSIKKIIDERVETTLGQVQGRHDNVIKTVDTVIIARDIVNAGYGDVSEYKNRFEVAYKVLTETREKLTKAEHDRDRYKAEIERLKSNNGFLQCVISHSKDMMDEAVKQAKIDVLNKLKSSAVYDDNYLDGYVFIDDVNKLIEEVQNAEDKG